MNRIRHRIIRCDNLVVSYVWPLNGILGGYEGHAQMGGGRDRMIKRVEQLEGGADLFGAKAGTKPG